MCLCVMMHLGYLQCQSMYVQQAGITPRPPFGCPLFCHSRQRCTSAIRSTLLWATFSGLVRGRARSRTRPTRCMG